MLSRKSKACFLFGAILSSEACRPPRASSGVDVLAEDSVWVNAPLGPRLYFAETVLPRSIRLLILDAHTGVPLDAAQASIGSSEFSVMSDQYGRALIRRAPPGRQRLRVAHLGYQVWTDSVTVSDAAGLAVVVQLRHAHTAIYDPAVVRRPP